MCARVNVPKSKIQIMKRAELMNYSHLENAPKLSQCTQMNVMKRREIERTRQNWEKSVDEKFYRKQIL